MSSDVCQMNVLLTHRLGRCCVIGVVVDSTDSPKRCFCLCATEHLDFHDTDLLRLEPSHHC